MSENVLLSSDVFKYKNHGLVYLINPVPQDFEDHVFDRIYDFSLMDKYDKQRYFGFYDQIRMKLDDKDVFVSTTETIFSIDPQNPIIDYDSVPSVDLGTLMHKACQKSFEDHKANLNKLQWNRAAMAHLATEQDRSSKLTRYAVESYSTVQVLDRILDVPPQAIGNTFDFWGPMHTQKAKKQIKMELWKMPEDGCFSPREVVLIGDRMGTTNLQAEITKVCCDHFEDKIREIIAKHATSRDSE